MTNSENRNEQEEPTLAPGMNMDDPLEEDATADDIAEGESTSVTRLYLDRTPRD